MSDTTLTIGGFARLTGLSVRALRLYDEQGLLPPRTVDASSGYRRYSVDQLDRGALIARLRRLDLPLEELRTFLDAPDRAAEHSILVTHRQRLVQRAVATADALRGLDRLMQELALPDQRPHRLMAMVIKTLRDQPVLRIRRPAGAACDPASDVGTAFAAVNRQGLTQAGPPYFSAAEPDDAGERSFESGIPVDRAGTAEGEVEPGVLPGGDVASVLYTGSFDGIDLAYRELWKQLTDAGFVPAGEPRDSYLSDPETTADPQNHFTEVIWPVTRPHGFTE
jgi:DNA-binding transcriptional MerR regulator